MFDFFCVLAVLKTEGRIKLNHPPPGSSEPQKPSDAALQWHALFLTSSCGADVEFEIVLPSTLGCVVVPAGPTTSQTSRAPGIFWTEIKMTATRSTVPSAAGKTHGYLCHSVVEPGYIPTPVQLCCFLLQTRLFVSGLLPFVV